MTAPPSNQTQTVSPGNLLANETSPYLLQHKDNPVHWRAWNAAALAEAQARNQPILLSVGYAACHWCHVMAHESFENPEIAQHMNRDFICIKVDREERPDIDNIYQSALMLMGEQGGWPLTMFLTPKGEPFWGGTYFPPDARYGRPGFRQVLANLAEVWRSKPEAVESNRKALLEALGKITQPVKGDPPVMGRETLNGIAERLVREIDPTHGGFGSAPKFPQPGALDLLWRAHWRAERGRSEGGKDGGTPFADAVALSVDRMCQGGIYDHLGGGFARYSTDDHWLAPHFEKMLYDNAQLLGLLARLWAATKNPLWKLRAEETVDWLLREMRVEGAAFAASVDADSEGHEGRFYVWSEAEIDRLLGRAAPAFKSAYGVTAAGNWEGANILHRSETPLSTDAELEAELARARSVLAKAREKREHPTRDDKVLADWNGLTITALADASLIFDRPEWLTAARRAFDFIVAKMDRAGRLGHAWRAGRLQPEAMLDDYAAMSRAALALYEATSEADYLAHAQTWVDAADRHYWSGEDGGYFFTAIDADPLVARPRHANDHATPSGNAMMLEVLARLFMITGDNAYRSRAEALFDAFAPELVRNLFPLAGLLNAYDFQTSAVQIVIVGDKTAANTVALLQVAHASGDPNRLVLAVRVDAALPATHPAFGKTAAPEGPGMSGAAAFVCRGQTCGLPVTDASALRAELGAI